MYADKITDIPVAASIDTPVALVATAHVATSPTKAICSQESLEMDVESTTTSMFHTRPKQKLTELHRKRRSPWTLEEDQMLQVFVQQYAVKQSASDICKKLDAAGSRFELLRSMAPGTIRSRMRTLNL